MSAVNYPLYIKEVNSMDDIQKWYIYANYLATSITTKNNFVIVDWHNKGDGYGKPQKAFLGVEFYYLWSDIKILTFEEFVAEKNVRIFDFGDNWEVDGRAERYMIQTYGIYDWYRAHKDKILIN